MKNELDEGFLDFLKRIWRSIVGKSDNQQDFQQSSSQSELDPTYSGVENLQSNDPLLKQKLARVFVRGLRLHQEAQRFNINDEELAKILSGIWRGRISLAEFLKLKQNGVVDRIYSRVREKVRYQRKKRGLWREGVE